MTAKIVVVGSLNMDLVTQARKIPAPGETIIGGDLQTIPGGKGANQAVAAARAGAQVTMVGRVGDDVFAGRLRDNLLADGIDANYVQNTPDTASGVALIVVDENGQNSIVVAPGANGRLTPTDVTLAKPAIQQADVLLLQLEVPLEAVLRAARLAADAHVKVILNPAPARPLPPELLALVDILIPNESETATLTGWPTGTQAELAAAAARLHEQSVATVILTLGERGALLSQAGRAFYHVAAFPVAQVVDTTAAGDAFVGGMATAVAEGQRLPEAMRFGTAAGALSVTRAGAQPSLPRRSEIEKLLEEAQ
ncbi:MAG TPA: ribokinase [Anaerolineae bacterium]|nr:ribokinase [Anaerolineae bacterium]